MNYKWIGAILVITGCSLMGFSMAASFRREERMLRQLVAALDFMACELQYRLTPLPELCTAAGAEKTGCIGKILTNLALELESQLSPDVASCMSAAMVGVNDIPKRVQEAFCIMGISLGRFDMEGQLKGLESVRSYCRRELEAMTAGRENRLRSYQTLGVCAGAALAILFV